MARDWSRIDKCQDVDEAVVLLNNIITVFNNCFPLIKVKLSMRGLTYMSISVKHFEKYVTKACGKEIMNK